MYVCDGKEGTGQATSHKQSFGGCTPLRNHEVEFLAHGSRLEYSPEILREATLRVEQKAVQSDTWCALAIRKDVDDVVKCKSKFSLSELSDVMWGLLRMAIESSGSGDVTSEFLSDNRVYSIFKRADDLILHEPMALKHIRP